jgi:hypothetical protein
MNSMQSQPQMALTQGELEQGIGKLPSLPAVVVELIQSLDDAEIDGRQLSNLIARDQVLVAKILRLANSSFYGMPGKITSIADATVGATRALVPPGSSNSSSTSVPGVTTRITSRATSFLSFEGASS